MNNDDTLLAELLTTDLRLNFRRLVLRYQDQLYSFAYRLTGSAQDAEDIVQEALMGAYVTLRQYSVERIRTLSLRPWLYKITLNVFRNSRRGGRLLMVPLQACAEDVAGTLPAMETERPDVLYEAQESRQELEQRLLALPEYYRLVIICYYFQELSYREIAMLLDQPLGTVQSRLHRGIQILRTTMELHQKKGASTYGARS